MTENESIKKRVLAWLVLASAALTALSKLIELLTTIAGLPG